MPEDKAVNLDEIEFKEYEPTLLPFIKESNFDCGNADLNEFLKEDVDMHYQESLTQTMLVIYRGKLIGFFSLLTDAINLGDDEVECFKKRGIRYKSFPAVKIGRLGVDVHYKRHGIGTLALKVIKGLAYKAQKYVGCRFLTVDAKQFKESIDFWEGHGFRKNLKENLRNRETISYRSDLLVPKQSPP
ncbi:MAG: GNAT family N-acetyltransferase [Candidatus ainarchaeum sp.]|nr:GNAT family N-acetyltransferase [Candidatus ainarchaeum sp.]